MVSNTDEIIQIKCPFDGAVLSVRNQPGIENKSVTCPVCKHKYPFVQFRRVDGNSANEEYGTSYPSGGHRMNSGEDHTRYDNNSKTEVLIQPNFTLGRIQVRDGETLHETFQLKPGRNIIGRKAQKSIADFQVETGEKRAMSREHIVINVKNVPYKGFVHYLSLYKEKVNPTYVGTEQLFFGDCIVLAHGDLIRLPDATLKFEIPDEDVTEL